MAKPAPQGETIAWLNAHGARVRYRAALFAAEQADRILDRLRAEIELDPPERSRIRRPFSSEWVDVPRQQAAYGDPGTRYVFSGTQVDARPWTPLLLELRAHVCPWMRSAPNFVLINRYRDGRDAMGWHADDERDLGPEPEIVSLTFGAERAFQFRHKEAFPQARRAAVSRRSEVHAPPHASVSLELEHGSLLWMGHPTNRDWKHQVPRRGGRRAREIGERWNLTWRVVRA